jgi:uncharacterized membrane protein YdjX (TVP38/TMEM64 family)
MTAPGPHAQARLTTEDKIAMCVASIALIVGVAVFAFAPGTLAVYLGGGLFGVAAIDLVSLAFLLVGESEDRDIARKHRVSRPD